MPPDFDIAIVGNGMVGATLALALANTGHRIALIDAAPAPAKDHRLIALTCASCDLLDRLSLWPTLLPDAAPIQTIHVSQQGRFGVTRLHASDVDRETLGHVVPAACINAALATALATLPSLTRLQPARVTGLSQRPNEVTLGLDSKTAPASVTTRIVIAADGTHSSIRSLLEIPVDTLPSHQSALVTVTHLQRDHQNIAYERFHATGALAMLPLTGQRVATIWTDQTEQVDALKQLTDQAFVETLQAKMGYRLGKLLRCDARFSYPLQWMQVRPEHQVTGRVLLTGNAAHTLHPIAAQGLNLALQEIASLADHFANQSGETLYPPERLTYISRQKNSHALSSRLTTLFTTDFFPLNVLRQAGLVFMDCSLLARRQFLRRAIP